jgi:hypothetical protein
MSVLKHKAVFDLISPTCPKAMKCEIWKLLNFNSLFLTKFSCTLLIVGNIEASQFLIHFLLLNLVVGCWLYVHYDNINLQLLNCSQVLYRLVTIRCNIYIQNNLTIKFLMSRKPNVEKFSAYSNKFFHNFHLSEPSFTCPGLMASGLARRLM